MRPTAGGPGALDILTIVAFIIAANGIGLRRCPEANRAEGQCGWSGAAQRRGTPSPTNDQVTNIQIAIYIRAPRGPCVICSIDFAFFKPSPRRTSGGRGAVILQLYQQSYLLILFSPSSLIHLLLSNIHEYPKNSLDMLFLMNQVMTQILIQLVLILWLNTFFPILHIFH